MAKVYLVEVRTGKVLKLLRLTDKASGESIAASNEALLRALAKECHTLFE